MTSDAGMLLILPYWPRLYSRLCNDQDRRVREMTQKAHFVGKLLPNYERGNVYLSGVHKSFMNCHVL